MLTCADFHDRIYDEDCRQALREGTSAPVDMARHLVHCHSCRAAFAEAASDVVRIPVLLQAEPPPYLPGKLLRMAGKTPPSRGLLDWRHAGNWAMTAGALAVGIVTGVADNPLSAQWQAAVFVFAAAMAVGVQAASGRWSALIRW